MSAEHKSYRKGREYPKGYKRYRKRQVGYCCEGCGAYLPDRRSPNSPRARALEIHHIHPISQGGAKDTDSAVLCGPNTCHSLADALTRDGYPFPDMQAKLGIPPFKQYKKRLDRGTMQDVEWIKRDVLRRMHRRPWNERLLFFIPKRRRLA